MRVVETLEVMVSNTSGYRGPADLLDQNGELIQSVRVNLRQDRSGGLAHWGGSIDPTDHGAGDWQNVSRIRLETGEIGDVILAEYNVASGGPFGANQRGHLQGSGPAPF